MILYGGDINSFVEYLRQNGWANVLWGGNVYYKSTNILNIVMLSTSPANVPMWFIRDLMVIVLFSPLVYYSVRKSGLFLIVLLLCYIFNVWIPLSGFSVTSYFFFSIGAFACIKNIDIIVFCRKIGWWIILNCTPKVRHKTLGVFFMKYSYEQRLIIVSRVKQGEAIAHLSKEYHISETEILAWVRMWDHYGRSGLEQQSHCRPTVKLKEEVVRLILEKGVPLAHVRVEYRIGKTALQRWVSVVRKYGYGALEPSKRRGRPPKYPMGRPKKKEPQTELERLQAENLRLKAENALLKKAKALVEAKKAQALLNGHGPSTN